MPTDTASGNAPLVSVICRTIGRKELKEALLSVAAQSYPNIELLVVNAAGIDLGNIQTWCGSLQPKIVQGNEPLMRAAAANAGLDAAVGELIIFLDEDDWFSPEHIEGLQKVLAANTQIGAAYSNTQKVAKDGTSLDEFFKQDFDRRILMHDNYIPIHSMLFRHELLGKDCRFDESFDDFEDWDFWIQLSRQTDFLRVDNTTAFYRMGGESTTAARSEAEKYLTDHPSAVGRAKLFSKWLSIWSGEEYNQMLGEVYTEGLVRTLRDNLGQLTRQSQERDHKIRALESKTNTLTGEIKKHVRLQNTLKEKLHSLEGALKSEQQKNVALNEAHLELVAMHEALDHGVKQVLNSTSWRITAPLRFVNRAVRSLFSGASKKKANPGPYPGSSMPAASLSDADASSIKFELDSVAEGKVLCVDEIALHGWALSHFGPVSCDIHIDGLYFRTFRPNKYRADVYRKYRDLEHSMHAGFDERVSLASLEIGKHAFEITFRTETESCRSEPVSFYKASANQLFDAWLTFHDKEIHAHQKPRLRKLGKLSKQRLAVIVNAGTDPAPFRATLDSLAQQTWQDFDIALTGMSPTISDDFASSYMPLAGRFKTLQQVALASTGPSYALALSAGECLNPHALEILYLEALETNADLVYSDHDRVDAGQRHGDPTFTWSWSPELLYSTNYVGGVFVARASQFLALDWTADSFHSLRYTILLDLTLRVAQVRRVPSVLWSQAFDDDATPVLAQEVAALQAFIDKNSLAASIDLSTDQRSLARTVSGNALVSIIIPTLGKLGLLEACIESLLELTSYKNFEVIILNNGRGENSEGFEYLASKHFTIIECDEPFNWARLNNIGASYARGEHLLFLNDDIEVIQRDWIEELLSLSQLADTGAVGCKLLYPTGALQHAGIFLINYGGGALHLFHRMKPSKSLYMNLDQRPREVSANTGACLMVARKKFDAANGFDEELRIVGNDVDLCLRLKQMGLRNLWTSRCQLIHHESISREPKGNEQDESYMWDKWGWLFESGDPHYSPRLSLHEEDCSPVYDVPAHDLIAALDPEVMQDRTDQNYEPVEGVNLIGYIRANMGLGEAARADARALTAAGIDFGIINFERENPSSMTNFDWYEAESDKPTFDINLIHINGDFLPLVYEELPGYFFEQRYNITYWAWELERLPHSWLPALALADEIWVPSQFVKDAVCQETDKPVTVISHNVALKPDPALGRERFNIPQSAFVFLAMYDTRSVAERKNPRAAVLAFQQAFSANDLRVCLVLKMNNPAKEDLESLQRDLAGWPNISILAGHHSRVEIDSLINCIDCYVSLHRSEGFGLGPAEAMSVGIPCILTDWSGNTDYMTDENCIAIDYELVNLDIDYGPYNAGQRWAEADVDQASRAMQRLVDDPEFAARIGENARKHIAAHFSPAAVGKQIATRLAQIRKSRG